MPRLDRVHVTQGILEMWDALGDTPRDEGYDKAVADAHAIEARLHRELDAQDRLDDAGPDLLESCQYFLSVAPEECQDERGDVQDTDIITINVTGKALRDLRAAVAKAEGNP
jgi:hypothetical protein